MIDDWTPTSARLALGCVIATLNQALVADPEELVFGTSQLLDAVALTASVARWLATFEQQPSMWLEVE